MTQAQLDRQVARATGESVDFVRSMGFSPLSMPIQTNWPQPGEQQTPVAARKRSTTSEQPRDRRSA